MNSRDAKRRAWSAFAFLCATPSHRGDACPPAGAGAAVSTPSFPPHRPPELSKTEAAKRPFLASTGRTLHPL